MVDNLATSLLDDFEEINADERIELAQCKKKPCFITLKIIYSFCKRTTVCGMMLSTLYAMLRREKDTFYLVRGKLKQLLTSIFPHYFPIMNESISIFSVDFTYSSSQIGLNSFTAIFTSMSSVRLNGVTMLPDGSALSSSVTRLDHIIGFTLLPKFHARDLQILAEYV